MFDLYHSIFIISYAESFVNNVLVIIHKFLSRVKLFEVNCYNTFDKSYKNGLHLSQKPKRAILQQDIITYKVFNHEIAAVHGHKDSQEKVIQNLSLMTK